MEDTNTPATPGTGNETNFTPNETKLNCAIMQNLTSEIQFDMDKVALDLGYKNAGSLRARWNSLKRSKIAAGSGSSGGGASGGVEKSTPSKKAKGTPKKTKAAEDDDEEKAPPKSAGKKVGRGKAKSKAQVKTEEEEEEEEALDSIEGVGGLAVAGAGGEVGDEGGDLV